MVVVHSDANWIHNRFAESNITASTAADTIESPRRVNVDLCRGHHHHRHVIDGLKGALIHIAQIDVEIVVDVAEPGRQLL